MATFSEEFSFDEIRDLILGGGIRRYSASGLGDFRSLRSRVPLPQELASAPFRFRKGLQKKIRKQVVGLAIIYNLFAMR